MFEAFGKGQAAIAAAGHPTGILAVTSPMPKADLLDVNGHPAANIAATRNGKAAEVNRILSCRFCAHCGYHAHVKRLGGPVAIVLACAAAYEWFVVEAILSEAIAALAVGVAILLVHRRLVRVAPPNARVSLAFVPPFVQRVLPGVVRESFDLLGPTLWRALVRREAVAGRWVALRYDAGDPRTADERGRRTVVIVGSNLTPNALPLDIDERAGHIVLHQLIARREAAAGDSRYPM